MDKIGKAFDSGLFELRLQKPSRRMHEETLSRRRRIAQNEGAGFLVALVDSDLSVLREYLEDVDRLCRDVWLTQGNFITPSFVRGTLTETILNITTVRATAIGADVDLVALRKRLVNSTPAHCHLVQSTRHLKGELRNQYEIEARELGYKNARPRDLTTEAEGGELAQRITDQTTMESNASGKPRTRRAENKPTDRRAMVDAYIEEVLSKKGKRITRKDIWTKAGYKTRSDFEQWQRHDAKHSNRTADRNFMRLLREKPHLK